MVRSGTSVDKLLSSVYWRDHAAAPKTSSGRSNGSILSSCKSHRRTDPLLVHSRVQYQTRRAYQKWARSRLVFWTVRYRIDGWEGNVLVGRVESYSHVWGQ